MTDVGLVGLGVMGRALALNLIDHGHRVVGWDKDPAKREGGGVEARASLSELVQRLSPPRVVLAMAPAGEATEAVIANLSPLLAPGDVLVDCGNAHFLDTVRRGEALEARGLSFIGAGVSGGEKGARLGPAVMAGGRADAWDRVGPIFSDIAAKADGAPCSGLVGPGGAGHFVKTMHNGIEYAVMQLIAEAALILMGPMGLGADGASARFAAWGQGRLESFLIGTAAEVLAARDADRPLVEMIADRAGQKGTGRWATEAALSLGEPAPTLAAAVMARSLSAIRPNQETTPSSDWGAGEAALESALHSAIACAYAQGFRVMAAGSLEYGWGLDLGRIAGLWRGGCIIRARMLDGFREATPLAPPAVDDDLRRVTSAALGAGVPASAFASALAYAEAWRAKSVGASLIQGMRDRFGAHGFERVDRDGAHHHDWD